MKLSMVKPKDLSTCIIISKQNIYIYLRNSLPNDKIFDDSKSKSFADDKINVTQNLKFVMGRVENIVGKGENAGYKHFLFFLTMFSKAFFFRVVKSQECLLNS